MTPKQHAEELVNRFRISLLKNSDPMNMTAPFNYSLVSKECALICINELIKEVNNSPEFLESKMYLDQVKQEIKKI